MKKAPKLWRFWTGPVGVSEYALRVSQAGANYVTAGTQHVYFCLPQGTPQERDEARSFVTDLYPHAAFEVEEVS
jgi:hypothetical protein